MPRLLRLARCQGYASFACGCGGIWCPCLQSSPDGGSTLMTSAPKSDKITAALGPAMKLAKSTTFNPEKILLVAVVFSVVMGVSFLVKCHRPWNCGARFWRNDCVDEPDAIGLLCADHLSGKNELQSPALADQPWQSLRSTAARNDSQFDF